MATITVTISKTGQVTIDVVGAVGSSCTELTKALEHALGEVVHQDLKPEFYAACPTQDTTIQY